jgi:hypothetical protein
VYLKYASVLQQLIVCKLEDPHLERLKFTTAFVDRRRPYFKIKPIAILGKENKK